MRSLIVLATLALLLAGCAEDAAPASPDESTTTAPSTSQAQAPPPPPAVYVGKCEATSDFSLSAAGIGAQGAAQCPFSEALEGNLSTIQAAVVEVAWTPAQPSMMGAYLMVSSASCTRGVSVNASGPSQQMCDHGFINGATSPLRLEIGLPVLQDFGDDGLTLNAIPDGVTMGQPFTLYVTLFEGVPPPGYSALQA